MKKIIALFLLVVMTIGLCACGGDAVEVVDKVEKNKKTQTLSKPTREEQRMIKKYINVLDKLDSYVESGEIIFNEYEDGFESKSGSFALEQYYRQIESLKDIEKWIGTEYCEETRTPQEVLDSFSVLKGVKLFAKTEDYDQLGNVVPCEYDLFGYSCQWLYDENGRIIKKIGRENVWYVDNMSWKLIENNSYMTNVSMCEMEYDSEGKLAKTKYSDGKYSSDEGTVYYISTPEYDDQGNRIGENIQSLNGDNIKVMYVYDEQNRVKQIDARYANSNSRIIEYSYTYDKKGNVLKEEGSCDSSSFETIYKYDTSNRLISAICYEKYVKPNWTEEYTSECAFTCDEQGRVETIDIERDGYIARKVFYTYGDYYVYAPAQ